MTPDDPLSHEDYLAQARHNERFLDYLTNSVLPKNSQFGDWALVVTFYAALHYTKAAIKRDHNRSANQHKGWYDRLETHHQGHNDLIDQYLPAIKTIYRELFDLGHEARYRGFHKLPGNLAAEVKRKRVLLNDIKTACRYS